MNLKDYKEEIMTEQTKKSLTKGDIRSTYWRSTFLLGSFNFERMQAMGFCVSMIPAIKRLYSKSLGWHHLSSG